MTPEQAQTLVGREFVHFKGKRYRLVAIAKHSETLEPIVVYRALYGEGGVWVRPFAMFFEDVDRDGYSTVSLSSPPYAPAFIIRPPPTLPGMPDANSSPVRPF